MFELIRKTFTQIKSFFIKPDPYEQYNSQLSSIGDLTNQFNALTLKVDQLQEIQDSHQIQHQAIQTDDEYQQVVVLSNQTHKLAYQFLTNKQREFFELLSRDQYIQVKNALKSRFPQLQQGRWLNDEVLWRLYQIINNYVKTLERSENVLILSSHHFQLLLKADESKFDRIMRRAGFSDGIRFVIIPYNSNNTHWYLITIDLENPTISIYDSMQHESYNLFGQINVLCQRIKCQEYTYCIGDSPQQENGYDCGVFMLKNIQILCKKLNTNTGIYFDQGTIFYDRLLICAKLL